MGCLNTCKALLLAIFQWSVLLKSICIGVLVGGALSYVNYGNALLDGCWPPWWKPVLHFVIPFSVEMLLCVFLNLCGSSEITEVIVHDMKQDQHMASALPEIAVYSGMMQHSKDVTLTTIGVDDHGFCEDLMLRSHHSWPMPDPPETPPTQPGFVRTHSLGMFTVDECMDVNPMDEEAIVQIRPLPKETTRKTFRTKSLGCISDLHGRQRIRIANAERLHVFNNGLYAGDSPPSSRHLD